MMDHDETTEFLISCSFPIHNLVENAIKCGGRVCQSLGAHARARARLDPALGEVPASFGLEYPSEVESVYMARWPLIIKHS